MSKLVAVALWCGLAGYGVGQTVAAGGMPPGSTVRPSVLGAPGLVVGWDEAFVDRSGTRPVHFVARYVDGGGGTHRLEEWRVGMTHLRRRTDDRIDLHADSISMLRPGQPVDYLWQILDLAKKIDHRVSSQGMLRAGMLYNYYSMAHVLSRPAGQFEVRGVEGMAPVAWNGFAGRWYEITAGGQATRRVCWMAELGIPMKTLVQTKDGWKTDFEVGQVDTKAVPASVFAVNAKGFQVRNVEELEVD